MDLGDLGYSGDRCLDGLDVVLESELSVCGKRSRAESGYENGLGSQCRVGDDTVRPLDN